MDNSAIVWVLGVILAVLAGISATIGIVLKQQFDVVKSQAKVSADLTQMVFSCQQGEIKRIANQITVRLREGSLRADAGDKRADISEHAFVALDNRLEVAEKTIQEVRSELRENMARIAASMPK